MRAQADITNSASLPGGGAVMAARTAGAAVSMTRFSPDMPANEHLDVTMPEEDAFVALYQLIDHPAHEFRFDGKTATIPQLGRSTLNIVDLNGSPCGRLSKPVDTLMFHLPRAALNDMAYDIGGGSLVTLVTPDPWQTKDAVFEQLQPLLTVALTTGGTGNTLLYDHMLLGLAAHFLQTYGDRRPVRNRLQKLAPWQERRAKEAIRESLRDGISLHDLARECNLSVDYFARAFRASTGYAPYAWLQKQRITLAKRMLQTDQPMLSDIANVCGFCDQSHFSRVFSRCTGMSPGLWRRQHGMR
jgi:AraC-like DNA-binding protein